MFGFGNKSKEAAKVKESGIDVTEVMADKEFIDFLGDTYGEQYLNRLDPERDAEAIEQRYEIFQKREETADRLVELYTERLDLIEVDDELKVIIKEQLERYIKKSPDRFEELLQEIKDFAESEKEVAKQEQIIRGIEEKYEGGRVGMQERMKILERAAQQDSVAGAIEGFLSKGKRTWFPGEDKSARERVQKEYGLRLDQIDQEIQKIMKDQATLENAQGLKGKLSDQYAEVRSAFLGDSAFAKKVNEYAQRKVKERVVNYTDFTDLSKMEEQMEFMEDIISHENDSENDMVLVGGKDRALIEQKRRELSKKIEEKIIEEIKDIVQNKDYSEIEKSLRPLLEKAKVGDSNRLSPRGFIREQVKFYMNKEKSMDPKKRFMLKAVLFKYSYLAA